MIINGVKYHRLYVRLDQLFIFEKLLKENNIDYFNEKELYTDVKSTTFYINEKDFLKADKIFVEKNIDVSDDYSSIPDQKYWIDTLPKPIKVIVQILIFVLLILFIFQSL